MYAFDFFFLIVLRIKNSQASSYYKNETVPPQPVIHNIRLNSFAQLQFTSGYVYLSANSFLRKVILS